jgi:hypothetical protein
MERDERQHQAKKHNIGEREMNDQVIGDERRSQQPEQAFRPARPSRGREAPNRHFSRRNSF